MDEYIVFHPDVVAKAASNLTDPNPTTQSVLFDMWNIVWSPVTSGSDCSAISPEIDELVAATQGQHGQSMSLVQALLDYREAASKQLKEIFAILTDLENYMNQHMGSTDGFRDPDPSKVGANQPGWSPPNSTK